MSHVSGRVGRLRSRDLKLQNGNGDTPSGSASVPGPRIRSTRKSTASDSHRPQPALTPSTTVGAPAGRETASVFASGVGGAVTAPPLVGVVRLVQLLAGSSEGTCQAWTSSLPA